MHDFAANFFQLLVTGLINGTSYALLGVAFALILGVSGRFHSAFAVTYTLSAYVASGVGYFWHMPFWLAVIFGALAALIVGVMMEVFVYLPLSLRAMAANSNALLMIFVASLGLAIVGRNLIALTTLSSSSILIYGFDNKGFNLGPITLTSLNIAMVVTSWALILGLAALLKYTDLGRMVRAVRTNWEMSLCCGINPAVIFAIVFAIGSFLSGVGAVFTAAQTSATADMGQLPFFYALVVAFLAGLASSPLRVATVALILGVVEALSALFLPTQWTSLVVFVILLVYVAMRPVKLPDFRKMLVPRRDPQAKAA